MKNIIHILLWIVFFCTFGADAKAQTPFRNRQDSVEQKVKANYTKREVMIPMRDGVKLYTAIYEPKNNDKRHPILIGLQPFRCCLQGDGISVDADEPTGGQPLCDLPAVAGPTQGAVHIDAVGFDVQSFDTLVQQDRAMGKFNSSLFFFHLSPIRGRNTQEDF